jgi:hypothetical protein
LTDVEIDESLKRRAKEKRMKKRHRKKREERDTKGKSRSEKREGYLGFVGHIRTEVSANCRREKRTRRGTR